MLDAVPPSRHTNIVELSDDEDDINDEDEYTDGDYDDEDEYTDDEGEAMSAANADFFNFGNSLTVKGWSIGSPELDKSNLRRWHSHGR